MKRERLYMKSLLTIGKYACYYNGGEEVRYQCGIGMILERIIAHKVLCPWTK